SPTGMGLGILGAHRLMDRCQITSNPGEGTIILLEKIAQPAMPSLTSKDVASLMENLAKQPPLDPFDELQRQNQELLATMAELHQRQTELAQLNRELEDTNRGVVALYAELDEKADYLRRASDIRSEEH